VQVPEPVADEQAITITDIFPTGYFGADIAEIRDGDGEFFHIAERPNDVSIRRPFYPARPGGTLQEHLVAGLGVRSIDDLLRRCDFGNGDRDKACALFWTLEGNQVGCAALAGWREMLLPAMHALQGELGVWPFEGELQSLLASKAAVIVETYPGDACVQLGLGAPGRGWSKRDRAARIEKGVDYDAERCRCARTCVGLKASLPTNSVRRTLAKTSSMLSSVYSACSRSSSGFGLTVHPRTRP
jgi:hypothetical protein